MYRKMTVTTKNSQPVTKEPPVASCEARTGAAAAHFAHCLVRLLVCALMLCCPLLLPTGAQEPPGQTAAAANGPKSDAADAAKPNMTPQPNLPSSSPSKPRFIGDAVAADITAPEQDQPTQTDPDHTPLTNGQLMRLLWANRIAMPDAGEKTPGKDELQRLIEQIRSVRFEPQYPPLQPRFIGVAGPTLAAEPNPDLSGAPPAELNRAIAKLTPAKSVKAGPYNPITDQTLQIVAGLLQHPDQVRNPFEMAELLFLCGRLKEAAVFYQHALSKTAPNDTHSTEDRAWLLFQVGNCLRENDPAAAKDIYMKLIVEYPNSSWTEIAKARGRLIGWYQKNDPKKLISGPGL